MDPRVFQSQLSRAVMSPHHKHLSTGSTIGLVSGMIFVPLLLFGLCVTGKAWWIPREIGPRSLARVHVFSDECHGNHVNIRG